MMKSKQPSYSTELSIAYLAQTPIGLIGLAASEEGLAFLELQTSSEKFEKGLLRKGFHLRKESNPLLQQAIEELKAYFSGSLKTFTLPIDWQRFTSFQEQVLRQTIAIPYGQVTSYAQIAREIGKPRAARAVGQVEAHNPLPIVIPCHRVIGSDGTLHGYGAPGGLETKARLLQLEGAKF